MAKQLDGPPWGTFVDEDEAYVRGQAGSVGSGLLGGWSFDGYGGWIDETPRPIETEIRAELHRLLEERNKMPA
jgi:hypothetical protein